MTLDILVCSIVHRTRQLTALLEELERQRRPGVGVRVFRDNLETGYGDKCQALLESSAADYVCFVDDDDMVAPYYVDEILAALESNPDYVGFHVAYTEDGVLQVPVIHSLRYREWRNLPTILERDIVHFNPIRRNLALRAKWEGGNGADRRWADQLRALGCVRVEAFVPAEIYHYQHTSYDTFEAPRSPMAEPPPRPDFAWVTWL